MKKPRGEWMEDFREVNMPDLIEEISKRDIKIRNLEKVIEYLKRESRERGEEIVRLKKEIENREEAGR